ncbi:EAL and HDOD domain-containing protein [Chitinilyticum piscinae]|uniref:HDOD domain-containing protein n=1 Tax=Chitinilyticum piscinae TaxID=2866724 RepID=A0A8J7FZQ2_9NEIS|nr:HDOD domain-containing protein [Chitinilyticum piscinae]MBE9609305.1 HDOD domain-containing protein [Chitinilyticum piscinae]
MNWFSGLFRSRPAPDAPAPPPAVAVAAAVTPDKGLLRRKPVYDRHWRIVASTFTVRPLPHADHVHDHSQLDLEILLYEVTRLVQSGHYSGQVWLELPWERAALLADMAETLPGPVTVILHGEHQLDASASRDVLHLLRKKGLKVGVMLDGWLNQHATLLADVQLLMISPASPDPALLSKLVANGRSAMGGGEIWLAAVDSQEAAEAGFQFGVNYVSGKVFANPRFTPAKLPGEFIKLNHVLSQLRQGADFSLLANELKTDPVLSVRLLRYVNSAALALPNPVHSLEQALAVLGQEKLYRWLSLLLFSSSNPQPLDATLLEAALTRARLMELAGAGSTISSDSLYLTGLFSLLDYLLRVPRRQLLEELCAPAEVIDTLAGRQTPLTPFLLLAEAAEGDAEVDQHVLDGCAIEREAFARLQFDATLWVLAAMAG